MAPPRRPAPPALEVDDLRVVAAGTGLWALALAVLGVLDLTGTAIPGWWTWMCALGAGLGVLGVRTISRRG